MAQVQKFGDLLDAVDNLSREEKEAFLEVLQRRLSEERRQEIAKEIEAARREFQTGESRPVDVDDLMKEIVS
jgi:hypothetical protein